MSKLDRFTHTPREAERPPPREPTSVNLERRQLDFIRQKNLNLSALVRALLERLMSDDSESILELLAPDSEPETDGDKPRRKTLGFYVGKDE